MIIYLVNHYVSAYLLVLQVTAAQLQIDHSEPWETEDSNDEDESIKTAVDENLGECFKDYSCSGCYKARVCSPASAGGYVQKMAFSCNDTSPSTPYCSVDTGTCTASPPNGCGPPGNFTCLRDGTFPDPNDCTKYFVCLNDAASAYKCERTGQNYDSSREACVSGATCYTFNCKGKHGVKVAYGKTANIFAYCINGTVYVVDRCPGNYEMNADSQRCEPVCSAEGYIPDVARCNRYYRCVKSSAYSSTYTITNEVCPTGKSFDALNLRCAPAKDCQLSG